MGSIMLVACLLGAYGLWQERKAERAYYARLASDPEFRRSQHEMRKYDDWEDQGYFDGR